MNDECQYTRYPGTRVHYFKNITNLRFLVLMCVLYRPLQQLLAGQRTVVALGHAAVRTERFDRGGLFGDVVGGSNGFCFTETRIRWKASGGSNDFEGRITRTSGIIKIRWKFFSIFDITKSACARDHRNRAASGVVQN